MKNNIITTKTPTIMDDVLSGKIKTESCPHCEGSGECDCELCTLWPLQSSCRDEFDTGRQNEGQCRTCNGFGFVGMDGNPVIEDTGDFSD